MRGGQYLELRYVHVPAMIRAARAAVRPRYISPGTGETFLLEDYIDSLARSRTVGSVQLQGPHGSGKTTALRHLAATLSPALRVAFLDDADPLEAVALSKGQFVVFTSSDAILASLTRKLATWTNDDFIEYLLARHPEKVQSVFGRIRGAPDRSLVGGSPELWCVIMDELAKDESLTSVIDALWRAVIETMPSHMKREDLERLCVDAWLATESTERSSIKKLTSLFRRNKRKKLPPAFERLLRHPCVQRIGAAECIARNLKHGDSTGLMVSASLGLVLQIARRVESSPSAMECLSRHANGRFRSSPTAASILSALDPRWRPSSESAYLEGAMLSGASWKGIRLVHADLRRADLSGSEMCESYWEHVNVNGTNLEESTLDRATIIDTSFNASQLENTSFREIKGRLVVFAHARLRSATFARAELELTTFEHCDLRDVCFADARLDRCVFERLELGDVDFRGARLRRVDMRGIRFANAQLDGTDFTAADLRQSDLEYVRANGVCFRGARLSRACLTGSTFRRADFRGANLRLTGLGDIDWEGADLRRADLRECSFHMGSTRCGLVDSPYPSHGTRTGFYTDDYNDQSFKSPEEIRKASLRGADLRGANITAVDFYLVDLREAKYDPGQAWQLRQAGAILSPP